MEVNVQKSLLSKNDLIAADLRAQLRQAGTYCINVIGSPGAGKTTLLERVCAYMKGCLRIAVIEGDIATSLDADRIARHNVAVHQINTYGACHLDAAMVHEALSSFDLDGLDLLIIENVGNLVCPTGFDLGEDMKVVVLSVPEGDDKTAKYPGIFRKSGCLLLNKVDLLPGSDFDIAKAEAAARQVNPGIAIWHVSAKTGDGLTEWCQWLAAKASVKKAAITPN